MREWNVPLVLLLGRRICVVSLNLSNQEFHVTRFAYAPAAGWFQNHLPLVLVHASAAASGLIKNHKS